ncbi:methyltransferase domain-containing protein [Streptomyces sp. URMC 123]|uniref:methyltransferase domain-containing protein n=1 Tax=Streptomyces sp. URMC 123 TaxID=3423403 RepID=UPI003F1D45B9
MTPTLVRQHLAHPAPRPPAHECARARDWAEIQERMLVPLYEAVYQRLEVGPASRLLSLGCGSGLALLMAAGRGAAVAGVEADAERLALARERLLPEPQGEAGRAHRLCASAEDATCPDGRLFTLVTAFDPQTYASGSLPSALMAAAAMAERGAAVVLAGWGPPERCATSAVLRVAARLGDAPLEGGAARPGTPGSWRPCGRDDLEETAHRAGLRIDGSGRVACPFGYADLESAIRGLLSTGLFDGALDHTDGERVRKELAEALHPYLREDGTVWMPNVFRYLIARV